MALPARCGSAARLPWCATGCLLESLEAAAIAPPPGVRFASSSGGSGGGGRSAAADAKQRAAVYVRDKERKQGREEASQPSSNSTGSSCSSSGGGGSDAPRSRLAEAAAEYSEAQQALFLSSPSGLGVGAEAAIAQAIKDGAFDNLAGKGTLLAAMPLPLRSVLRSWRGGWDACWHPSYAS